MDIIIYTIIATLVYLFMGLCVTIIICNTKYFNNSDSDDGFVMSTILIWPIVIIVYAIAIFRKNV